ncbi:endonuclease-8/formamidopyrimidine-DNA glycosylase [Kineococcus xinjiangensis]|uniref:DNA-(apurinic or apyrimidinic site) lyase n=1 Tax=Kineococcus xinjiangensis TaxID=512762 RepID=A0A2S6IJ22_9ACTN|nr:DNA-formamidopyrimidine glycosylase family protein [Kineococcus xinjiangensis]PPK94198.1 endonuclease-8/formamidopyrimidine-DNA glycosylase [Kineococcus xinjiangensis]
MPEGNVVHRNADEMRARFAGRAVRVDSPQGRFEAGAALLDSRVLEEADAHGKHLLLRFAQERWLHVHLGLYGSWTTGEGTPPQPRGAVRVRLQGPGGWAELRGPTACEVLDEAGARRVHERLGPDPLRADADPDLAWARISRSRTSVGVLLMQQDVVSGVGAIYRAEVLFRVGVSPHRPGRDLTREEWGRIWEDLVLLMRTSYEEGRIETTRPQDRELARAVPGRGERFYVFRRTGEPCRACGEAVAHELMATRHLNWCPGCQPR